MAEEDVGSPVGGRPELTSRSNDDSEPAPAPKRRRIGLACSACRIRKSRCNGVRPKCEPCNRLGYDCIYELPETSANFLVPRDTFSSLEDKVRLLELTVRQQSDRLLAIEAFGLKHASRDNVSSVRRDPTPSDTVVVSVDGIQDASVEQSMTDGMAIEFVDDQDCGYFGPSSNIALMRHIFRAMVSQVASAGDVVSPESTSNIGMYQTRISNKSRPSMLSFDARTTSRRSEVGVNVLPSDSEMRQLLATYFSNTGLLFPFIHEESFMDVYDRTQSSGFRTNVSRTWLGLLNLIFAMAVSASDNAMESPEGESDVYYQRARRLCDTQMLRGTTLETAQYLLLMSQYLQGTQKSVQTWNTHGLAVKAALSIGLHSRDAMKKFPVVEQEMRKRTWFGCILLDRSLSMTFGRPGLIPEMYVKLPLPQPVDLHGRGVGNDSIEHTSIAFYNATITLYGIMAEVIGTLYGHNLGCDEPPSRTEMITDIFQLERRLLEWQRGLPLPLTIHAADSLPSSENIRDRTLERFRLVLSLRYLNLELLVHRPMLTSSLVTCSVSSGPVHTSQDSINHMQDSFNKICVRRAEDIINIIHQVLVRPGLGRDLIGAWWFTLYYIFNAALTLFGGLLVPNCDGDLSTGQLDRLIHGESMLAKAIDALLNLGPKNATLGRCVDYIKQLRALVERWSQQGLLRMPRDLALDVSDMFFSASTPFGNTGATSQPFDGTHLLPDMQNFPLDGVEDELELGNYFTSEFQRWFHT